MTNQASGPPGETDFTFDCIAFKRQVQERLLEATRDMPAEQELAYYREQAETGPLGDWWRSLRAREETQRVTRS